jgi:two-component system phosphate regulon sensor histidine kinase PhoR
MNPKLLFWIPALLRMTFIMIGAAIVWSLFGAA